MRILRTAFTVSDADRSLAFYRDVLGLEPVRDKIRSGPSYDQFLGIDNVKLRVVIVKHPQQDVLLELIQYLQPPSQPNRMRLNDVGAANVAFDVDDAQAIHQRLTEAGYRTLSEPVKFVQEGVAVGWIFTAFDPDEIPITVLERL
jgi:catechol 2,3-dioxygenase-like lactoylglutathione lyase family enzyme